MSRVALLDELAVNATAARETQYVDGWAVRASVDLPFRRANCAIALRDAGTAPIDVIEAFYAARSLPSRLQVTTAAPPSLGAMLAERGYEIEAPVDILVADVATVSASPRTERVECTVTHTLDAEWAEVYSALHDGNERVAAYGRMLKSIGPPACAVTASVDGEPAGMGFGVVERGWCGIYGMTTLAPMRRKGVASTVLGVLADEAAALGAQEMYLQVERDNAPARALYHGVKFAYEYGYDYRIRRKNDPDTGRG